MKKVIITGVNGFIGGAMAEFLKEKEYYIIGIGRKSETQIKEIEYYQMNLVTDNITDLLCAFSPDFFIHCAGSADVGYSIDYPDDDLLNSVVMTERILYQILHSGIKCKFIYLSSAAVYGEPKKLPVDETSPLSPISPYALHKQMVENVCFYFIRQYGMDIKILRIFSAYGIGLKKQLLWDIGKKILKTHKIELFGTGEESRDYIYITDLTEAIFCIMNNDTELSTEILNIASGVEIKISELAYIYAEKWGISTNVIRFNGISKTGNPINWCADIHKLLKLGFKPKISIDQGIEEYVKWFKNTIGM